jgi:glycerophosphoryl diester phosphodiesterase
LRATLENFSRAAFNIEIKELGMVPAVLRAIEASGASRLLLTAGSDAVMRELEAARPGVPLGLSSGQCFEVLLGAWRGQVLERYRGRALQVPPRRGFIPVLRERLVRAAHAAGIEVHVWTINDPDRARRLLALGIDGIMSDDPGALAGVIQDAQRSAHPEQRAGI